MADSSAGPFDQERETLEKVSTPFPGPLVQGKAGMGLSLARDCMLKGPWNAL